MGRGLLGHSPDFLRAVIEHVNISSTSPEAPMCGQSGGVEEIFSSPCPRTLESFHFVQPAMKAEVLKIQSVRESQLLEAHF